MPIYEYHCADCGREFQKLRPMSKATSPASCVYCGRQDTRRAISLFTAVSKGSNGGTHAVSGTRGGCASCAGTSCATCSN